MTGKLVEINLFGACTVRSLRPGGYELRGAKHKALMALLATAPFGRRSRTFLQDTLWGTSCYDQGRQSFRRALSDIKQIMGDDFGRILVTNSAEVTLDLARVAFTGQPGRGDFLEGLDIREEAFAGWLRSVRADPHQLAPLYRSPLPAHAATVVPAIAILPFRLVMGEERYRPAGDWIAEEICRSLSRTNLLAVISHLSSRAMAASSFDLPAIRNRLGVDYCVSGSIRIDGGRLVADADFVDAHSGRLLWTRRFAGRLEAFFAEAPAGIAEIVRSVAQAIADDTLVHVRNNMIGDIEDHRLLVGGVTLMHRPQLSAFARARELIEEAVRRSPSAAEAHAWRGKWYILSVFNGWSTDPGRDTGIAVDSTARALDINPENAFCLTMDGFAHNNLLRRLDVAEQRYGRALALNPNEALSWLLKGALHAFSDDAAAAVRHVEHARRLSPLDPFGYYYDSLAASAHLANGDLEQALGYAQRSYEVNNRHASTLRVKIAALHFLDRGAEARAATTELRRRQPAFTVSQYLRNHPGGASRTGKAMAEALRACGVPD